MRSALAVVVSSAGALLAQSVSLGGLQAPQGLETYMLADATLVTDQLPAGPLPPSGALDTFGLSVSGTAGGLVGAQWGTTGPESSELLRFEHRLYASLSALPGQVLAGVDPHELVLTLSAPAPRAVTVQAAFVVTASQGVAAPTLEVDLFDDGVVDWSAASAQGAPTSLLVGPAGVTVRLRGAAALQNTGGDQSLDATLALEVRADNGVQRTVVGGGCGGGLLCEQAFEHDGLRLRVPFGAPSVAVFGFVQQALTFPPIAPGCMLVPTVDAVFAVDHVGLDVFLPPAVRPVTFYTQAVSVDLTAGAFTLRTSDAVEVVAN